MYRRILEHNTPNGEIRSRIYYNLGTLAVEDGRYDETEKFY